MYGACTTCCDLAKATCTSRIVALKALLAKQTNGEKLSTMSDVRVMVGARYQLPRACCTQPARAQCVAIQPWRIYKRIVAFKALMAKQTYGARLSTPSGVKAFVEALVVACYQSTF